MSQWLRNRTVAVIVIGLEIEATNPPTLLSMVRTGNKLCYSMGPDDLRSQTLGPLIDT